MANEYNLKPVRSEREARELGRKGGKKSGEARRRKAALRDTMNRLLTMQVNVEGLSDVIRADSGEDTTYEDVITMAMIQQAMMGDVKAYQAIMKVVGQTERSEEDLEEQKSKIELNKARKGSITGENETDEALDRLDQILKEVRDSAVKQEAE
ncbi:hypothetical protein [[Ruminococcus] lactaris]|uniref:hypothetical protein n=1 Tax=[Ruminococcus] lactaris TaxID=46228 RepID=UPI0026601643|nr:hypothetical protein [[Ruminococcus] lactaris]